MVEIRKRLLRIARASDVTIALRDANVSRVVRRHARLSTNGPMLCKPSQEEIARPYRRKENKGSDYKVIYPSREAAEAAARELELEAGFGPQFAYACRRSQHDHYHLTSNPTPRPGR